MPTKICLRCKEEKDISFFYQIKSRNAYKATCKTCLNKQRREYRKTHKVRDSRKYRKGNKAYQTEYRKTHTDKKREYNKKYRIKSKEKQRIYEKQLKQRNPNAKIAWNLRSRIYNVLKGIRKCSTLKVILGCDLDFLIKYLEYQFKDGMSWDNYGQYGWHIDHVRPCSSFDLTDIEQQKQCFHYTNLQPLWWKDNLSKGNKYNG